MKSYNKLTLEEQIRLKEGDIIRCDLCDNQGKWQSEINLLEVTLPHDDHDEFAVCEDCKIVQESRLRMVQALALLSVQIKSEDYYNASHTAAELARLTELATNKEEMRP